MEWPKEPVLSIFAAVGAHEGKEQAPVVLYCCHAWNLPQRRGGEGEEERTQLHETVIIVTKRACVFMAVGTVVGGIPVCALTL